MIFPAIPENRVPSVRAYNMLRQAVGLRKCDEIKAAKALDNSLYTVVSRHNDVLNGIERVIGDGLYYYIQDLKVHPDHQGKGIGTSLMQRIMTFLHEHIQSDGFIGPMTAEGLSDFYLSFGFQKRSDSGPGMFMVIAGEDSSSEK